MSKDVKNVPALRFKGYSDAWEKRKLREVSDVRDGTHASPKYYSQGYPLVTSKNLTSAGLDFSNISLISELDYKNINKRSRVDKGDILFGMIGTIGTPVMVHESNFAIKNVALIKEREAVLNSFLVQLLKSPAFINYIRNENVGGTQKFLSLNTIRNFRFSFPTSKEQAMVSRFLEKIDSLIAATQDKIDALEQAKRALLQRLFDQSWRFKGYSDPWEKRKLSEVTNLITKGTTPREKGGRGEVNFIKVENLSKNGNIFTTSKVSVSEHQGYLARSILQENDILFSIAGSLGRTAIVPKLVLPANTNQALAIIRLSTGCVEFVATYLSGEAIDRYIRRNPTVGAQPNISLTQVASLQIDWPSLHEQEVISKLFARVKDLIAATQSRLSSLELLKKALLQDLFI
ncbi:EcoKI restriction-modification system protein HsdS [Lacticaseibacillus paracasei]|uniref:restriction endonuclease subunit S n=2 Tax=Lacticaseibacillus paracasei TaxID=1597 RepID=UPI000297A625|nr:restriction endonuclease subunit S [Lacticaseibacillus paracasei]EKQ05852.1 type I restriction-modification system, specificity subunit S [Lacticaseibacillus paracasei]QDR75702.1 restriction endonuclease subunit S [Lacticaseibacillus paracasei]RNE37234.1 EcoKI restriction-modification system protein HsdS [Lacticaseibacillus paracasei]WFM75648.1 restriction endonuclease subunit S [Lacticaseibacillus paracasei]